MIIIKYNKDGDQLWNITKDVGGWERIEGMALDSSGDIFVTGQTFDGGNQIRWVIGGDGWLHYTDDTDHALIPYDSDRWYHTRFKFDCGIYGDGTNDWHLWIDGISLDLGVGFNFAGDPEGLDVLISRTGYSASNYYAYIDAIGYSWDPDYNIGDNFNEGLLLSYDNTTTLDWKGYSLDNQVNKTIMGNATIPIPIDGVHNIQVFGNGTLGTMYESNMRYFSVDTTPYINIGTPENITYTEPMSGYYPATYGFENDTDGSNPSGWSVSEVGGTIDVISSLGGHSKIVEIFSDSSINDPFMKNNFYTSHESGTVEFWMRSNDVTKSGLVYIQSSGGIMMTIGINNDHFVWTAPGNIHQNIVSCNDNTWYHVRVDFECGSGAYQGLSADHFYIYINGQRYGEFDFRVAGNNIELMGIFVWGTSVLFNFDAIGYSWDPNYNIGDNLNEGLLLSYDTNTDFNWQGYSLDSQSNKTILGNTTIPIPSDGIHSIQVFGNDSLGDMYESDLRYFTTNALGPEITINSPISNQLFGITPPDFSLTILDSDLDARWYSLDGGNTNVSFSGLTGTIDQTEWDKIGNGTVTITFYANDTINNIGQTEVLVRKDVLAPLITINSPIGNQVFGENAPSFDLTILENQINSTWYTLDYGSVNISFSGSAGTIDQTEWAKIGGGTVPIRFYANDSLGNVDFSEVIMVKDIISPSISINSPSNNELFGSAPPTFDITVTESNPDSMWYTLDSGGH